MGLLAKSYYGNRTEIVTDYTATEKDTFIAVTSLAGPITVTLPDPKTVGPAQPITVKDESGAVTSSNTITVVDPTGTIEGTARVISNSYGSTTFYSSGKKWLSLRTGANPFSRILSATISTQESMSVGGSFIDLATPGPLVTLVTNTSALVWLSSWNNSTGGGSTTGQMSVEVSGASTVPATFANCLQSYNGTGTGRTGGRVVLLTGLTPGVNTFKAKYNIQANAATFFSNRSIAAMAL